MQTWHRIATAHPIAMSIACTWTALLAATHVPTYAAAQTDAEAIRSLIGATWDKPGAKVEVDPIVVAGDYAIAGWTQSERGGRALLQRKQRKWSVVLCSGDPLKSAAVLVEAGVPEAEAKKLAADLATAEVAIDPHRQARFSLFEGTVTIEDPAHDGHVDHTKH